VDAARGTYFPAGDACVDIIAPSVKDAARMFAGLVFTSGGVTSGDGAFYFFHINLDGTAGVTRISRDGWLQPVPARKFAGIKPGSGVANTLRVVWSGPPFKGLKDPVDPSVSFFINDQLFTEFKVSPNSDRLIGLVVQSEGNTYQFNKLEVTSLAKLNGLTAAKMPSIAASGDSSVASGQMPRNNALRPGSDPWRPAPWRKDVLAIQNRLNHGVECGRFTG
jgi:hypothetical protein